MEPEQQKDLEQLTKLVDCFLEGKSNRMALVFFTGMLCNVSKNLGASDEETKEFAKSVTTYFNNLWMREE